MRSGPHTQNERTVVVWPMTFSSMCVCVCVKEVNDGY